MRKMIKCRFIITIIVCVFFIQLITPVFAHPASQENVLSKSYCELREDYYIGGEDVGWFIDEDYHTNGTTLTYSISESAYLGTEPYRSYIFDGAALWNGVITIIYKEDGTGTGLVTTDMDIYTSAVATCGQ